MEHRTIYSCFLLNIGVLVLFVLVAFTGTTKFSVEEIAKNTARRSDDGVTHYEIEQKNILERDFVKTPLAQADTNDPLVHGFTGVWPILSEMPLSGHRDTACPMTHTERSTKKLTKKWPDAIGIGFPKCGTGTLGFLDCHSKFVFRNSEPYFWNKQKRIDIGLEGYALPLAAEDEILIEKTPDYTLGTRQTIHQRAQMMKQQMPNAKLIVMLCDPAERAFSHVKHQSKYLGFDSTWRVDENDDPLVAFEKLADFMNPEEPNADAHLRIMDFIIPYGNFFTQLAPYIEVFGRDSIHFVDGGRIISEPASEFAKIEQFFGVASELEFKFNGAKGFPCLEKPVPYCLSDAKGRTRSQSGKVKPTDKIPHKMRGIRKFYKDEMMNMFQYMFESTSVEEFCNDSAGFRFSWLEYFICI